MNINEEEEAEKHCDKALKPTEPQPGGSPLGKWKCNPDTGKYYWDDPQIAPEE